MSSIHEMPFVRLVFLLGIGILFAYFYDFPLSYSFIPFATIFFALTAIYAFVKNYWAVQFSNILLALLLILGGASSMRYSSDIDQQKEIPKFTNYNFEGIVEDIKKSEGKHTCTFKVFKYFNEETTYYEKFKVRLSISKYSDEVLNGDQLIVNGMLTSVFDNKNPHTFNFKKYLSHKHIFYQLSAGNHDVVNHKQSSSIILLPTQFNNYAQTVFKKYLSIENASIAIGMITGGKSDIPKDLLETYSKVGVMHLLAVSGLHVGIISEALFFMFGQKKRRSKKKKSVLIIIIAIWLFVLFTGSSAATVRAGLMFTMLNIARVSDRLYHPFNAVAGSAFGLLIYDPYYLFDLGFQLSYLAVTSIIFFYPLIKNFLDTSRSNKLIKGIWNLTVLSISANILILPLTIYYFNQVPIYFPFTNIIAVPAAGGIVIGGIAMIGVELILPIINEYYAILYEFLIISTNWFLKTMEQIPFSTIENIRIDDLQVGIAYFSILILAVMIIRNKIGYLKYMIASVAMLLFYSQSLSHSLSRQSKFTIYNIYNKTAIDFTHANKTYSYIDDSLSQSFIDFNIQPNRLASNCEELIEIANLEELKTEDIYKKQSLIIFSNQLFFIPSSRIELQEIPKEADFVVVNHTYGLKDLTIGPHTKVILRNDKYLNNWKPNIPENQLIRIYKHGAFTKLLNDV